MPQHHHGGRHELGQNFLTDPDTIRVVLDLVTAALQRGDTITEIGAGRGALTVPLADLGRPLRAIELDERQVHRLRRRLPAHVRVEAANALDAPITTAPHVLVGNLPFHLTTTLLRRLLRAQHWHTAVLLTQWEVARRRAGVGGASMLTASWWPWYTFTLHRRVPARAFTPAPSVDGGLLTAHRRSTPLVDARGDYQALVKEVFTGRGRGITEIIGRTGRLSRHRARIWARDHDLRPDALPKNLTPEQWAALHQATRMTRGRDPRR